MSFNYEWIPHIIYIIFYLVSTPIYTAVITIVLKKRTTSKIFQTPFYSLILSQGISDLIGTTIYLIFASLRLFPFVSAFLYEHRQWYFPQIHQKHIFLFLNIRCTGFALIACQRCIAICYSASPLDKWVIRLPPKVLMLSHTLIGTIFSLPVLLGYGVAYSLVDGVVEIVQPPEMLQLAQVVAIITLSTFEIICAMSYLRIIIYLRQQKHLLRNQNRRSEHQLAIQAAILTLGLIGYFTYHAIVFIGGKTSNMVLIHTARRAYPPLVAFGVYLTPWTLIAMNQDIKKPLIGFLRYGRLQLE